MLQAAAELATRKTRDAMHKRTEPTDQGLQKKKKICYRLTVLISQLNTAYPHLLFYNIAFCKGIMAVVGWIKYVTRPTVPVTKYIPHSSFQCTCTIGNCGENVNQNMFFPLILFIFNFPPIFSRVSVVGSIFPSEQ